MATAKKKITKVKYQEPTSYFPKEIMNKYFKDTGKKKSTAKKK